MVNWNLKFHDALKLGLSSLFAGVNDEIATGSALHIDVVCNVIGSLHFWHASDCLLVQIAFH